MKRICFLPIVFLSIILHAQDDDCLDRILAKNGGWKKNAPYNKASAADFAIQKKFTEATYSMMSLYQPRGIQAEITMSHSSAMYQRPVAQYTWFMLAMKYFCKGEELVKAHETNTAVHVIFNPNFGNLVFDPTTDYMGAGFDELREGFPEEIKPGVWRFKDVWTPLGFTNEGLTKLWLFTYPGQLPWQYVTRKEFLQRRRSNLLRMVKEEEDGLKRNLADLERQKKDIQQILKNDPAKYAAYIKNDYEPAPKRFQDNHDRSVNALNKAIDRVNGQLEAPENELNKKAIVLQSTQNHLDYDFVDTPVKLAKILVKPNPSYFKKGISPSVPQLISFGIPYHPVDSVYSNFARDIEKLVNEEYIQSFIGKTTPPPFTGQKPSASGNVENKSKTVSSHGGPGQIENKEQDRPKQNQSSQPAKSTTSQKTTGKSYTLAGNLSAPAGVPVTISYNNGNDLTITPQKAVANLYNTTSFTFSKKISEGESFDVSLKKIASNMRGVVFKGKGQAPDDVDKIKVGVDFTYELLTRSTGDKKMSTFYESFAPAVGGRDHEEGRYVVFVSNTKDLEGSTGKFRQVFWRDRNTGITKLISVSATGEQANADCGEPSISVDGKTVTFESKATNLVTGDNNNFKDIFVWRHATNTVELVSRSSAGMSADGDCFDAAISGNGNFVVFTSSASNLSSVPKGRSLANIYLRDLKSSKTEMISFDPSQNTGGNGYKASISYDGSRITFCSAAGTLVSNDNNNLWDIFLWQKGIKSLKRVSLTHDGKERNGGTESASRQVASSLSGNGKFVAFVTTATNMVPGDNNIFQDVFIVEIESGKVNVASFTNDGLPSNNDSPIDQGEKVAISYDGRWVAFPTKATNLGAPGSNIILYDRETNKKKAVSEVSGSYVGRPAISYSGSYVVFGKSTNLDNRFSDSGIFAHFTGNGPTRE